MAITKGFTQIAELLLVDDMSTIDYKDNVADTPLHWAVILGNEQAVNFLLDHGSDPTVTNDYKNTPLMVACLNSNLKIIECFMKERTLKS